MNLANTVPASLSPYRPTVQLFRAYPCSWCTSVWAQAFAAII